MNGTDNGGPTRHWWPPAFLEQLRCVGEIECVVELISCFTYFTSARLQLLSDPRARSDRAAVFKELRNLEDSCQQLGADLMASICQQIEDRGFNPTTDEAGCLLEALRKEGRCVMYDMRAYAVWLKAQVGASAHPPAHEADHLSGVPHNGRSEAIRPPDLDDLHSPLWSAMRQKGDQGEVKVHTAAAHQGDHF